MRDICNRTDCGNDAVALIPMPDKNGVDCSIRVCQFHYGKACEAGFYVIHDNEKESAASTRCERLARAKHRRLFGSMEKRVDEFGRWLPQYRHLQQAPLIA